MNEPIPSRPPLSPAAQAVLEAAQGAYWSSDSEAPADASVIAAAALRAAATYCTKSGGDFWRFNTIATELENIAEAGE